MLVFLVYLGAFTGILYYLGYGGGYPVSTYKKSGSNLGLWIAALGLLLFLVGFVSQERFIRSHDHAGYYRGTLYVAEDILSLPLKDVFGYLYNSINQEEYSALICYILGPGMRIAGYDIPTYTLLLGICGLVPLLFLLNNFSRTYIADSKLALGFGTVASILAASLPAVLKPMLQGMADIVVMPFALIACLGGLALLRAFTSGQAVQKVPLQIWISIFCTLLVLPILRRYFGIFTLAWFPSLGFAILGQALIKPNLRKLVLPYGMFLFSLLLGLFFVWFLAFPQLFHNLFLKQYGEIYKAYKTGTQQEDLLQLWMQFGPWIWGLGVIGIVSIWQKKEIKLGGIFLTALLVLTVIGVWRIQSFSPQHYYLPAAPLMLLIVAGMLLPATQFWNRIKFIRPEAVSLLFIVGGGLGFLWAFPTRVYVPEFLEKLRPTASSLWLDPRVRTDLSSIRNLAADMETLNPMGTKTVYVGGSSNIINDDILRNMGLPEIKNGLKGLLDASKHAHVDRRDPFPKAFLAADFVVVPVPMQFHLKPEDQQLAAWIQETVTDTLGLGQCFSLIKTYPLENGVQLRLYERIRLLPYQQVLASIEPIKKAYPQYPAMYDVPNRGTLELSRLTLGDGQYALGVWDVAQQRIDAHPGKTTPTEFVFVAREDKHNNALAEFTGKCENGASVYVVVRINGAIKDSCLVDVEHLQLKNLDLKANDELSIRIYPGLKDDFCDHLYLNFR